MTREELLKILNERSVPTQIYSLDGIEDGECLCIDHQGNTWDVVYNERGKITYRESYPSEEAAYEAFYQEMKRDYHWP